MGRGSPRYDTYLDTYLSRCHSPCKSINRSPMFGCNGSYHGNLLVMCTDVYTDVYTADVYTDVLCSPDAPLDTLPPSEQRSPSPLAHPRIRGSCTPASTAATTLPLPAERRLRPLARAPGGGWSPPTAPRACRCRSDRRQAGVVTRRRRVRRRGPYGPSHYP